MFIPTRMFIQDFRLQGCSWDSHRMGARCWRGGGNFKFFPYVPHFTCFKASLNEFNCFHYLKSFLTKNLVVYYFLVVKYYFFNPKRTVLCVLHPFWSFWRRVRRARCQISTGADAPVAPALATPLDYFLRISNFSNLSLEGEFCFEFQRTGLYRISFYTGTTTEAMYHNIQSFSFL